MGRSKSPRSDRSPAAPTDATPATRTAAASGNARAKRCGARPWGAASRRTSPKGTAASGSLALGPGEAASSASRPSPVWLAWLKCAVRATHGLLGGGPEGLLGRSPSRARSSPAAPPPDEPFETVVLHD